MAKTRQMVCGAALAGLAVALGARVPAAPEPGDAVRREIVTEATRLAGFKATRLSPDYLTATLSDPSGDARLAQAIAQAERRVEAAKAPAHRAAVTIAARDLIRAAEDHFIHDPNASTLDLLPPDLRARYKTFAWNEDDYPGGPLGPNEDAALALDAALATIRPERRANSTSTAVVTKDEFDEAMWAYIRGRRTPVPGQEPRQLDRDALSSFQLMRAAAKKDGVDLVILSSDRLPEVAARNAQQTANPYAVAQFSSHILGLAMDLKMSGGSQTYDEVTTRPMANIIAMRSSPVHKWLFLRGAAFGWYPYTHEPWHWEYNPPGFRERFRAGLKHGGR